MYLYERPPHTPGFSVVAADNYLIPERSAGSSKQLPANYFILRTNCRKCTRRRISDEDVDNPGCDGGRVSNQAVCCFD